MQMRLTTKLLRNKFCEGLAEQIGQKEKLNHEIIKSDASEGCIVNQEVGQVSWFPCIRKKIAFLPFILKIFGCILPALKMYALAQGIYFVENNFRRGIDCEFSIARTLGIWRNKFFDSKKGV